MAENESVPRRRSSVLRRSSIVRSRRDLLANQSGRRDSILVHLNAHKDCNSDLLHLAPSLQRFWQVRSLNYGE